MSRLLTIIALLAAWLPSTVSARTIADLFATEPGTIFPLLTGTNRLDMVDYYNSGQIVDMGNNMLGESRLLELDSAYLKVQTSGSRTVEMMMRTVGKDTVVTVIETVLLPVPDSRLTQWNSHWQQYTSEKLFAMPGIDDFIVGKMPRELRLDLNDVMVFAPIQLAFKGEKHDTIEATHGLELFLTSQEYKRFANYLKPTIRYQFNGLKIKPIKK